MFYTPLLLFLVLVTANPNALPNTANIPTHIVSSCKADDGVLYIDTVQPFTRPTPPTLPSCASGYTFATLTTELLYYSALLVGQRCMGTGSSFWAASMGIPQPTGGLGYYMLVALLGTDSVAKGHLSVPTGTATMETVVIVQTPAPEAKVASDYISTLYTPSPYVCLNTAWTSLY